MKTMILLIVGLLASQIVVATPVIGNTYTGVTTLTAIGPGDVQFKNVNDYGDFAIWAPQSITTVGIFPADDATSPDIWITGDVYRNGEKVCSIDMYGHQTLESPPHFTESVPGCGGVILKETTKHY